MKKCLLYWGIPALLILCTLSCAKTGDDTTPPVIGEVMINSMDTVRVGNSEVFYTFNVDETAQIDTLVLGKRLNFKAKFSDNESLSSYFININVYPDNEGIAGDTVYTVMKRWVNIFGMKNYSFEDQANREITIPDSLSYQGTDPDTNQPATLSRPVRVGFYNLEVKLLDAAGNQNSVQMKVHLLNRKTIIDSHLRE